MTFHRGKKKKVKEVKHPGQMSPPFTTEEILFKWNVWCLRQHDNEAMILCLTGVWCYSNEYITINLTMLISYNTTQEKRVIKVISSGKWGKPLETTEDVGVDSGI